MEGVRLADFRQLPSVQAEVASLQALVEEVDFHIYEIVAAESKGGMPQIKVGEYFVLLNFGYPQTISINI